MNNMFKMKIYDLVNKNILEENLKITNSTLNNIVKIDVSHCLIYNINLDYYIESTWFNSRKYKVVNLPFSNKEDALFVKDIIDKYYIKRKGILIYEEKIAIIYNDIFHVNNLYYKRMTNIDIINNILEDNSYPDDFDLLKKRKWLGKIYI